MYRRLRRWARVENPADEREECCAEIASRKASKSGSTAGSGTFFCLISDLTFVSAAILASIETLGFFNVPSSSVALASILLCGYCQAVERRNDCSVRRQYIKGSRDGASIRISLSDRR